MKKGYLLRIQTTKNEIIYVNLIYLGIWAGLLISNVLLFHGQHCQHAFIFQHIL